VKIEAGDEPGGENEPGILVGSLKVPDVIADDSGESERFG
jgi:hypothetical protein